MSGELVRDGAVVRIFPLLTPLCGWAVQRFAIRPEEEHLERKFGDVYLTYKRRVRRWL